MNLLNGLAVSDTGMIREKAEVVSAVSRVETISYIESLLLGDPFDFLSNWPVISWIRCDQCINQRDNLLWSIRIRSQNTAALGNKYLYFKTVILLY